jgi:hypothetical protein
MTETLEITFILNFASNLKADNLDSWNRKKELGSGPYRVCFFLQQQVIPCDIMDEVTLDEVTFAGSFVTIKNM